MARSATVHKLIEVVGTSQKSFSEAARTAVSRTAESVRELGWFEVTEMRGRIVDGEIAEYQVTMKIGFKVK